MKLKFTGQIDNRTALIEQLSLPKDVSQNELIIQAYKEFKMDFNQHVSGDYALILPLEDRQLFFCLSAFSSYQLFYRKMDGQLQVESSTDPFNREAKINPLAVSSMLETGIIVPPLCMIEGVSQLASGESQLWCNGENPQRRSEQRLSLSEKLAIQAPLEPLAQSPHNKSELEFDFNQLPGLSRLLGQPVNDTWQIRFAAEVPQMDSHIISDAGPQHLASKANSRLTTKLAQPLNKATKSQFKALHNKWHNNFKQQLAVWPDNQPQPEFERWFALQYGLPAVWANMRRIAEGEDKTIRFSYTNPILAATLLDSPQEEQPYQAWFGFNDANIKNPYDAMQRLMWQGYQGVTDKLFHIVPPLSAGLLKKHSKHPEQVDSFCFNALTLDHLARQYRWSL